MSELISVILPVYNCEKYLAQAIESIINQTYKNLEIIIINDGSKDNSLEVINKYRDLDTRIIVRDRENRGLIATLNEGISLSKGNYLVRMDQDDISLEDRIQLQYEYMIKNDLDLCGGNYTLINENNEEIRPCDVPQNSYEILVALASNVPFAHPTVMIRKNFLLENNLKYGLDGYRNAEDLDLWIACYDKKAKIGNTFERLIKYRILGNSMSRSNVKRIKKESNLAFNNMIKKHKNDYKTAFIKILEQGDKTSNSMKRSLIRANWRYFFIYGELSLFLKVLVKTDIKSSVLGTISFIKHKFL